ncbi:MAG: hypothetical protein GY797_32025 [Deltaproteobacteria bacterium]|nr:hypothetical protein [Deltaproteobacteria bacterium]
MIKAKTKAWRKKYDLELSQGIRFLVFFTFLLWILYMPLNEIYELSELKKGYVRSGASVISQGTSVAGRGGFQYLVKYRYKVTLADGQTREFTGRGSLGRGLGHPRRYGVEIIYAESNPSISRLGSRFNDDWWQGPYIFILFDLFCVPLFGFGCFSVWREYLDRKKSRKKYQEELADPLLRLGIRETLAAIERRRLSKKKPPHND